MAKISNPADMTGASNDPTEVSGVDARIKNLAERWQDLRDAGQNPSVEDLCAQAPELIPGVREWLAKVGKLEAILATQAPSNDTLRSSWSADNVLAAPQGPDELGRLGGYRVLKLIGQGGMGKVYLAEDLKLKRRVALKVLLKGGDQRFLREAQTLAKVEHDHIVTVYQIDEDRGTQFLAMPYLQGETLEKRLTLGRLPLQESVRIARQITQGLAVAHAAGVFHRDIKPSNIWLEAGTDRVKILDFGLARDADGAQMLTQEGAVVGTPAFMAPEQAQGNPVDHRADLFSLGCVLYQMISGVSPFARKDILSTLRALEMETPELPTVRYPETPGPLSDLAMALLAKKPGDRPGSSQIVLEALQSIERDVIAGTAVSKTGVIPHVPAKSPAKGRGFPIAAAIGVAGCLAVAAYMFWPPSRTGDPTNGTPNEKQVAANPNGADSKQPILPDVNIHGVQRKDFKITVELPNIEQDENEVRQLVEGQTLQFKIGVEEDAYVGIWYQMDDGSVKQLFPNEFDRDHYFQKGKSYQIPSNEKYDLKATPSKSLERFHVAASTKKWDWDAKKAQDGFRMFQNEREFGDNLRGVVLVAKDQTSRKVSQLSMPVWVSPKK